MQLREGMRS